MKAILSLLTVMALSLVFVPAFADDIPVMNTKDIGSQLYDEALARYELDVTAFCAKDFSTGVVSAEVANDDIPLMASNDIGTVLYSEAFPAEETMFAERGARGEAAGGFCPEEVSFEDEKTVIWDHALGTPGGSDLP